MNSPPVGSDWVLVRLFISFSFQLFGGYPAQVLVFKETMTGRAGADLARNLTMAGSAKRDSREGAEGPHPGPSP